MSDVREWLEHSIYLRQRARRIGTVIAVLFFLAGFGTGILCARITPQTVTLETR